MTTPLQLLFAPGPGGDAGLGQVAVLPITMSLDGVQRPEALDRDGIHFVALTLGAQDLVGLATRLGQTSDFYPVEIDIRDALMDDPEDADHIEATLLGYLLHGERDRILNFVTTPGSVFVWAIGLSSPTFNGKVTISRDGTLQTTPRSDDDVTADTIATVLRALHDVLAAEV